MKKRVATGCGCALLLFIVVVLVGVRLFTRGAAGTEPTETAQIGDVEIKVVETGTIEPLRKVDIKSKEGGRVSRLYVDAGNTVRNGQIVASVDPQEINSQVAALRAQLAAAEARLASAQENSRYQVNQTRTSIDGFRQNLASAKAHSVQLENEAAAQPRLTSQSIRIAQANLKAAQATLNAQQQSLDLLRESTHPQAVVSAQSGYDQARAQADNAARTLQRQQRLLTKGFISQQTVDSAEADSQVAAAHLQDVKERLDRIQQTNALEEANVQAQVASSRALVQQNEAALDQARSSVLPASTRREMESARAQYRQARAQLDSALSGISQNLMRGHDADAARADVSQIRNQLDEQLVHQHDTTLYSPMSGVITKRYIEAGELITSAIGSFSSGTAVMQVADLAVMLVKVNINEVDITRLRRGMLTEVTVDAARGATFTGSVRKVAPSAASDSSAGATSAPSATQSVIRFPVEITLRNADGRLRPGMSARCSIIVARKRGVLRLPINCVSGGAASTPESPQTATVMARKEGEHPGQASFVKRTVTVGLRSDDFVQIISGLKPGDKVKASPYSGPARKGIDMSKGPH